MKQILNYLKYEKLGTPVLPPFKEFSGTVAAKIKRNGSEEYIAAKWNPDKNAPDVAFDPNAFKGVVSEFVCLYGKTSTQDEKPKQEDSSEDSRTNKELDALLLSLGVDEKTVKYLPNKAARLEKLAEVQKVDELVNVVDFDTMSEDEIDSWLVSMSEFVTEEELSEANTLELKVKLCKKIISDFDDKE